MNYLALSLALLATAALADNSVNGYVRKDGTYVQPHYQKNPNSTLLDNYSTKGNTNPYTGKSGTVDPYKEPSYDAPKAPSYGTDCHYSKTGKYVCR